MLRAKAVVDHQAVNMLAAEIADEDFQEVLFKRRLALLAYLICFSVSFQVLAGVDSVRRSSSSQPSFRCDDEADVGVFKAVEDVAYAGAFVLVVDLAGDSDLALVWKEHQVFAGDGNLACEAGSF